jgi:hypothetical protein
MSNIGHSALVLRGYAEPVRLYRDCMTAWPTAERMHLFHKVQRQLEDMGAWQTLDALYLMGAHHEQAGRLNFPNPTKYTLTAVNSPTPVVDQGFLFDGTTNYCDTGLAPSALVKGSQNVITAGAWSLTGGTSNVGGSLFGCADAAGLNEIVVNPRYSGDGKAYYRSNEHASAGAAVADTLGFYRFIRSSSTQTLRYKDTTYLGNDTTLATGLSGSSILVGAENSNGSPGAGTFFGGKIGMFFVGSYQGDDIYNPLYLYMHSIGAV